MLANVKCPRTTQMVQTTMGEINTAIFKKDNATDRPAIVLLHGWGGALGYWALNIDALAEKYTVYAIDWIGWGRSSRQTPPTTDAHGIRDWWVDSLEQWRQAVGLARFELVGHSAGGAIAGFYA